MVLLQKDKIKELLEKEGIKNTKKRNLILEVLENSSTPITAEQIFLKLKENNNSIWISTIYRTLEMLMKKGIVTKTVMPGESKALFELDRMQHKHHIICMECNKMMPVDDCPLKEYEKNLMKKTDFDVISHRLEIYGYCPSCKKKHSDSNL